MKRIHLSLLLIFFTLLYACQNTNQSEESLEIPTDTTMLEEENPKSPDGFSTSTNVSPPLELTDVPVHQFKFNTQDAQTLEIKETGSSIVIPENAFVDANGQPIEGEVEIQFKEYHDIGDILASGIPMRMTAPDGSTGYMQSAGMFDIQGTADGTPIFIAEGKSVEVNLASDYNDATYDFWNYQEESKQWLNKGVSKARKNEQKEKVLNRIAKTPEIEKPVLPYRFDKNKPVLEFDINYETFPELKEMNGILWQYAGDDETKDPLKNKWIFKEHWDAAEIQPFPKGNLYRLELKNDTKSFITTVCPSQSGDEFEAAMAAYSRKQKEYEANKLTREDLLELAENQKAFVRSARLEGFGIYNYDLMIKDEDNILVDAKFDFGTMIPGINQLARVYMIVDNRNVVEYPRQDWNKVRISPTAKTRMMAILPGQKYATITETQFEAMKAEIKQAEGTTFTFKMNYKDEVIASINRMKDIISNLV